MGRHHGEGPAEAREGVAAQMAQKRIRDLTALEARDRLLLAAQAKQKDLTLRTKQVNAAFAKSSHPALRGLKLTAEQVSWQTRDARGLIGKRRRKMREYGPHLDELAAQNIYYRPCCFSSYGRVHPEAVALLSNIAKIAARRRGQRAIGEAQRGAVRSGA